MKNGWIWLSAILLFSCKPGFQLQIPKPSNQPITGTQFYQAAVAMNWKQRDSLALQEILAGNIPAFLKKFVPLHLIITDSFTGKSTKAILYVSPDYLSIGNNQDWARIPLTPMAAQRVADSFHCFLPTKKLVDEIYHAATVQLAPVPLEQFRDSTPTMYEHHRIIEAQRKNQKGLIAGIKKDVILTDQLLLAGKQNKVAIYGWHQLNGKPIQPVYTGHINWYVDYSHGIRLIYQYIWINGAWVHYTTMLNHPVWRRLLTDEMQSSFVRYPL